MMTCIKKDALLPSVSVPLLSLLLGSTCRPIRFINTLSASTSSEIKRICICPFDAPVQWHGDTRQQRIFLYTSSSSTVCTAWPLAFDTISQFVNECELFSFTHFKQRKDITEFKRSNVTVTMPHLLDKYFHTYNVGEQGITRTTVKRYVAVDGSLTATPCMNATSQTAIVRLVYLC